MLPAAFGGHERLEVRPPPSGDGAWRCSIAGRTVSVDGAPTEWSVELEDAVAEAEVDAEGWFAKVGEIVVECTRAMPKAGGAKRARKTEAHGKMDVCEVETELVEKLVKYLLNITSVRLEGEWR